jgi:hypothetical protein
MKGHAMATETEIRAELAVIEAYAARVTDHLRRVEGRRDKLLAELQDLEGAHDRRPVAVR